MKNKNMFGFTLIELLIVVAIIAILAAIAIPNFLMAQIRSKVSRSQAELRTLATALEAYYTDNSSYPLVYDGASVPDTKYLYLEQRWAQVTTPVAYITSIPRDPFGDQDVTTSFPSSPFHYRTYDYVTYYMPGDVLFNSFFSGPMSTGYISREIKWYAASQGPDLIPGLGTGGGGFGLPYDPSNGTVSKGDVFRTGP